ncbi:Cysteine protease ATG4B [Turdus rufiventris]|nr:Cysteine protease ATG4B [Turdus rufiventris]
MAAAILAEGQPYGSGQVGKGGVRSRHLSLASWAQLDVRLPTSQFARGSRAVKVVSAWGGHGGEATLTYDTLRFEYEDFPETKEPVWILGRKYSVFTGGTGPTSDTGWGCMLRCGQMIFAQALVCRHLGRDWRWIKGKRQTDNYFNVLNAFIDKKDSYYSIHQIAQMGVGEGKSIGQWYGPNTVAQVLKKLATFDTWSSLAVHIAMDNTVVMEEIRRLCQSNVPCAGAAACPALESDVLYNGCPENVGLRERLTPWKPLVLLIPLRLGLTEINEAYIETLKHCFMMPQSLGVIGGKPNSAHYFIGYVGEELIYLDPHTTQPAVEPSDSSCLPDESFHCQHPPCRMSIAELDPSIAVLSLVRGALPMFELVERQPSHFSNPDVLNLTPDSSDADRLERFFDSEDEDFEILSL